MEPLAECSIVRGWTIKVTLHQTKDLKYSDNGTEQQLPNQWHAIRVGTQVMETVVRTQTSSTAFDQHATFSLHATIQDLTYHLIEISSYHKANTFSLTSALIGRCAVSPRTVWEQSNHSIIRAWEDIRHPERPGEAGGQICFSMKVLGDSDEASLAVPAATPVPSLVQDRHYVAIHISIIRGEDIAASRTFSQTNMEPYVEVIHDVYRVQTSEIRHSANPEWEQQLVVSSKQPALDNYVRVSLWNGKSSPSICGTSLLKVSEILATNKPSTFWINYYWNDVDAKLGVPSLTEFAKDLWKSRPSSVVTGWDQTPSQLVRPSFYAGRVLVSITTKIIHSPMKAVVGPCSAVQSPETSLFSIQGQVFEIVSSLHDLGPVAVRVVIGPHKAATGMIEYASDKYKFQSDRGEGLLEPIRLQLENTETAWLLSIYVMSYKKDSLMTAISAAVTRYNVLDEAEAVAVAHLSLRDVVHFGERPTWVTMKSLTTQVDVFKVLLRLVVTPESSKRLELTVPLKKAYNTKKFVLRCFVYQGLNIRSPCTNELPSAYVKLELATWSWTSRCVQACLNPFIYESVEHTVSLPDDIRLVGDLSIALYHQRSGGADELIGQTNYNITLIPNVWRGLPQWIDLYRQDVWSGQLLCAFELLKPEETINFPFYQDIRPATNPCNIFLVIHNITAMRSLRRPRLKISYGRELSDTSLPLWSSFTSVGRSLDGAWKFTQTIQICLELPKHSIYIACLEVTLFNDNSYSDAEAEAIIPLSSVIPWYSDAERKYSLSMIRLHRDCQQLNGTGPAPGDIPTGKKVNSPISKGTEEDYNFSVCSTLVYEAADEARSGAHSRKAEANELTDTVSKLPFDLKADEEDVTAEDEKRERVGGPLESLLDFSGLPYSFTELYVPNAGQYPFAIGQMTYEITATPLSGDALSRREGHYAAPENQFEAYGIEARVYCLQAIGLESSGLAGSASAYYLILDFPGTANSELTVNDKANARPSTGDPTFNRCFRFAVEFPSMAVLRIRVMQVGTLKDDEIGQTFIQLDNLWWLNQYRSLVEADAVPIERRALWKYRQTKLVIEEIASTLQHSGLLGAATDPIAQHIGYLTMWIELLPSNLAQTRPVATLSSANPQPFQLRVVIWRVRGCKMGELSSLSLLVSGSFRHADDSLETQWTDTHYNSRDGSAIFNWRFVWNIAIPARFSTLVLSVHQHSWLGPGDVLGTISIDLQRNFSIAQRTRHDHEIPRSWADLQNPIDPRLIAGQIEYEVSVVSQKNALLQPVGLGRDGPNRSPYLEPVIENRSYVDWQSWSLSIKDLTAKITWTTKWLMWIIVRTFLKRSPLDCFGATRLNHLVDRSLPLT